MIASPRIGGDGGLALLRPAGDGGLHHPAAEEEVTEFLDGADEPVGVVEQRLAVQPHIGGPVIGRGGERADSSDDDDRQRPDAEPVDGAPVVRIDQRADVDEEGVAGFPAELAQAGLDLVRIGMAAVEEGEDLRAGRQVGQEQALPDIPVRLTRPRQEIGPFEKDDIVRHRSTPSASIASRGILRTRLECGAYAGPA